MSGKGTAVHAASFIRQRRIILETSLLTNHTLLGLILVHEVFHFAWPHLSNRQRAEYTALLSYEMTQRARGELGDSSALRKQFALQDPGYHKEYVCESFCDTAAYLYAGVAHHPCFQLARRWTSLRVRWFTRNFTDHGQRRA